MRTLGFGPYAASLFRFSDPRSGAAGLRPVSAALLRPSRPSGDEWHEDSENCEQSGQSPHAQQFHGDESENCAAATGCDHPGCCQTLAGPEEASHVARNGVSLACASKRAHQSPI